jgi:hypothetical protein
MRLTQTLLSQAVRFLVIENPNGGTVYGVNLAREFERRYGFLEGPKTVADFELSRGVNFHHGFFNRQIVIDRCQIYNNGIVAETKSTVEQVDMFIDDVVKWLQDIVAIRVTEDERFCHGYYSTVEFHSDINLDKLVNPIVDILDQLSRYLSNYGYESPPIRVTGTALQPDATDAPFPKPQAFSITRREGQPFGSNLYHSNAPLKTADHIALLELAERTLR